MLKLVIYKKKACKLFQLNKQNFEKIGETDY